MSALPPVGSARVSPQFLQLMTWVVWLKMICSFSQVLQRTLRKRELGRGIRFSHSAIYTNSTFLSLIPFR